MTVPGSSALFAVLARLPDRSASIPDSVLADSSLPLAAARHGVAAWVFDALHPRLPSSIRAALETHARETFATASRIKRLTLRVIDALAAVRIVPVLLKGSAIAQRFFPANPLVRPASDVDILVGEDALTTVARALGSLGLAHMPDSAAEDPLETHHHLAYVGQPGLVEVHFRLTNTFGRGLFDDERVRGRALPYRFDGRPVMVLSPEDEFLYLATHAANHTFLRASWLVDLQQFLRLFPELDFHRMAVRARDAGFTEAVTTTLGLLERLLEVQLPAEARRHFPVGARRALDSIVFSGPRVEAASWSTDALGGFALRLWMVDSPTHAFRHVSDGAVRYLRRALSRR
ncbi:MAG: nucleotidyltransferase family protein [Archangiaceae bacterium]|nr:nucleotidyltransferase family protein [Archangiaceae bacterium]